MKLNLQRLRKEAGFRSAKAFAEQHEIPVATYTDWEQGRRTPTLETAWQLADALGAALGRHVSLDELAGRDFPVATAALDPDEGAVLDAMRSTDARGRAAIVRCAKGEAGVGLERPPGMGEGDLVGGNTA